MLIYLAAQILAIPFGWFDALVYHTKLSDNVKASIVLASGFPLLAGFAYIIVGTNDAIEARLKSPG